MSTQSCNFILFCLSEAAAKHLLEHALNKRETKNLIQSSRQTISIGCDAWGNRWSNLTNITKCHWIIEVKIFGTNWCLPEINLFGTTRMRILVVSFVRRGGCARLFRVSHLHSRNYGLRIIRIWWTYVLKQIIIISNTNWNMNNIEVIPMIRFEVLLAEAPHGYTEPHCCRCSWSSKHHAAAPETLHPVCSLGWRPNAGPFAYTWRRTIMNMY